MKYIILISLVILTSLSVNGEVEIVNRTPYYIQEAAGAFKLSPALLLAMCVVESRCKANAVNKKDSILQANGTRKYNPSYGLFQLKYWTAKGLGYQGPAKGLLDPEVNSFYAAKLFRQNLNKYGKTIKAISAHNAGRAVAGNKHYVELVLDHYVELNLDRGIK